MASERRIEKINSLLREEIAKIINRELEFAEDSLVTLTKVETSEDLLYSNIFFSVLGGKEKTVLEILDKNIYDIQQMLNKKLRMRPVPKIRFSVDRGEEKREGVEKSLAELKKRNEL